MKMNRRNALIGLGAIATGGGALFGSGAFSQVTATRNVTVGIQADNAGDTYLGLAANNTDVANNSSGTSGNQVGISATKFNPDATTKFNDAIDITNNGNEPVEVAASSVTPSGFTSFKLYADASINSIANDVADLSDTYITLSSGATLTVGIEAVADDAAAQTSSSTIDIEAVADPADFTVAVSGDSNEDETS